MRIRSFALLQTGFGQSRVGRMGSNDIQPSHPRIIFEPSWWICLLPSRREQLTIVLRLTGGDLVAPSIIWPLLTAEFPEVYTAATFILANVILHELAVSSSLCALSSPRPYVG